MSFEMNNSWLNLTNQSFTNENDERFNFKSTSEDFFTREGERFVREDPLLPFSNSVLTDITQQQDQSWSNEHGTESPGCSTTAFFMAKSSTPDEMLNALLTGTTDAILTKENQQPRHIIGGWNDTSSLNKKLPHGFNFRQQKDSPFNENCNTIVKKAKTVLSAAQPVKGEVSRSLFDVKPKSTSTSVNCDMLDLTTDGHHHDRRHSLDLSDSMSILSLHCHHHPNGNIYATSAPPNPDISMVNTETQTSHLVGSSSSSSSSTTSLRSQMHHQQQQQQPVLPSTHFPPPPWVGHHPQPLFYPVVSYHPIYSYGPSTSSNQHPPGPLCIHPPPTTISSSSSDVYNHHHDINNSPIITSLHSQHSDEKSSFQRNSRSSSSSLLSANSQRTTHHHQITEQHDHWWLDIPSSTIFRMPSCFADQKTSIDVPIKNNGSVDITLSVNIHKWDVISDTSTSSSNEHQHPIIPFQLDKIEYLIKSQQQISIKVHFYPFQTGNYQCKLNIKCQFCPQHQSPSSSSIVTLVGVCHDTRSEHPTLLSSTRDQRMSDENLISRTSSSTSQVTDMSLASTTAQSDGDLTSTSQHRQKDAILDIANQIGIEQNVLDFGQIFINDDSTTSSSTSKSVKLTIKNYSRTDACDVDISEPHLPFCISVRRATIREKSFVKLTCKFRPKKIGLYSETVILTVKRRNNFKTTITLTGRCILGTILQDSTENEE